MQVHDLDGVFSSVGPQLSGLRKELGRDSTKAILVLMLNDAIDFFSVGKSMGAQQVSQTADFIIDDYWMLKPEDLKLFFNDFKKGKFGAMYDRIDGSVILEKLTIYTNERFRYAATRSETQSNEHKVADRTFDAAQVAAKAEKEHAARVQTFAANVVPPEIIPAK